MALPPALTSGSRTAEQSGYASDDSALVVVSRQMPRQILSAVSLGRELDPNEHKVVQIMLAAFELFKREASQGALSTFFSAPKSPSQVKELITAMGEYHPDTSHGDDSERSRVITASMCHNFLSEFQRNANLRGTISVADRDLNVLKSNFKEKGASPEYFALRTFLTGPLVEQVFSTTELLYCPTMPEHTLIQGADYLGENGILGIKKVSTIVGERFQWTIVNPAAPSDQHVVLGQLRPLLDFLRKDGMKHTKWFTLDELSAALAMIQQFIINYWLAVMKNPIELGQEVLKVLDEIEECLYSVVRKREMDGPRYTKEQMYFLANSFRSIHAMIEADDSFMGLFSSPEAIESLKKLDLVISAFHLFLSNSKQLVEGGQKFSLVKLTLSSGGIDIYKSVPKDPKQAPEVLIFFSGHNNVTDRQLFKFGKYLTERGLCFDLKGDVHSLIYNFSADAYAAFDQLFSELEDEGKFKNMKAINFIGYGLNGCTAALVGYQYKRFHHDCKYQIKVASFGSPDFMSKQADASMKTKIDGWQDFEWWGFVMPRDPTCSQEGYGRTASKSVPVPPDRLYFTEQHFSTLANVYTQELSDIPRHLEVISRVLSHAQERQRSFQSQFGHERLLTGSEEASTSNGRETLAIEDISRSTIEELGSRTNSPAESIP